MRWPPSALALAGLEEDLHGASLIAGFLVMAVVLAARRVPVHA